MTTAGYYGVPFIQTGNTPKINSFFYENLTLFIREINNPIPENPLSLPHPCNAQGYISLQFIRETKNLEKLVYWNLNINFLHCFGVTYFTVTCFTIKHKAAWLKDHNALAKKLKIIWNVWKIVLWNSMKYDNTIYILLWIYFGFIEV